MSETTLLRNFCWPPFTSSSLTNPFQSPSPQSVLAFSTVWSSLFIVHIVQLIRTFWPYQPGRLSLTGVRGFAIMCYINLLVTLLLTTQHR